MLELDAGFAGGVCRCSSCGTLMTVPSDAGRAETLSRPEPGEASVRAGIAGGESSRQRTGATRSPAKRGKKGKGRHTTVTETTVEAGEYRTATGKVVRLDEAVRVPMAQGKRKKVQAATAIIFFSIILAVVGLAIFAIVAMVGGPKDGEGTGETEPQVVVPTYDPGANPFDLAFANLGGIPLLEGDVTVVIDTALENGRWMPQASELITAGMDGDSGTAKISFFAAGENGAVSFKLGDIRSVSRVDTGELGDWFASLQLGPQNDMTEAIEAALDTRPDVLVIIVGSARSSDVDRWSALLDKEDVTVHALVINGFPRTIQSWLRGRDDSVVRSMSVQEIESWQEMAESADEPGGE